MSGAMASTRPRSKRTICADGFVKDNRAFKWNVECGCPVIGRATADRGGARRPDAGLGRRGAFKQIGHRAECAGIDFMLCGVIPDREVMHASVPKSCKCDKTWDLILAEHHSRTPVPLRTGKVALRWRRVREFLGKVRGFLTRLLITLKHSADLWYFTALAWSYSYLFSSNNGSIHIVP